MRAMGRTEGVVHIYVGIRRQRFGKFLLTFFHGLLGGRLLLFGSIIGQSARLAFFFGIETQILKQQRFARLQGGSFDFSFFTDAVVGKLYINAEQVGYVLQNMFQRIFIGNAFGTSQV